MMSFSLSGGVEVLGFISPTDPLDTYPVIDPLYGVDGFRNVDTLTDLNNIPNLRRRAGMVVGVSGGTQYYKLNQEPWNGTISDWDLINLGIDIFTSGFTYNDNNILTIKRNDGVNISVTIDKFSGLTINGNIEITGNTFVGGNIEPINDDFSSIGSTLKRFREINTVSGTTSYWTSTTKIISPEIELGTDILGNTRIITANNSIIQNDTLQGGTY